LMYAFGKEGKGMFPAPTVFEAEFRHLCGVQVVGHVKTLRQQFYAISADRRIQHPAVMAIIKAARQDVFG
jgi:LysR family transcriptional activator of nhaA